RLQKPLVGLCDPLAQGDPRLPAELLKAGHIQQLSRSAIRLAGVELQAPLKAHHLADEFRQLPDRNVLATADVYDLGLVVVLQEKAAGICQIAYVQELRRGVPVPHTMTSSAPASR